MTTKTKSHYCTCCGQTYFGKLMVADAVWQTITEKMSSFQTVNRLCPNCMVKLMAFASDEDNPSCHVADKVVQLIPEEESHVIRADCFHRRDDSHITFTKDDEDDLSREEMLSATVRLLYPGKEQVAIVSAPSPLAKGE